MQEKKEWVTYSVLTFLLPSVFSVSSVSGCSTSTSVAVAANELILRFSLSLLEECGSDYLPVVKLVVALCTGEEHLDESDVVYLREVLKLSPFKEKGTDDGSAVVAGDKAASGEQEETAPPTPVSRTDSRAEAQKLFDKMKSGRRKIHRGTGHQTDSFSGPTPQQVQKRGYLWEGKGLSELFSVLVGSYPLEDELLEANMQKLREMKGAQKILDLCLSHSLPVLAELEKNQGTFLSVAGKGSLQTVTCR